MSAPGRGFGWVAAGWLLDGCAGGGLVRACRAAVRLYAAALAAILPARASPWEHRASLAHRSLASFSGAWLDRQDGCCAGVLLRGDLVYLPP